MGARLATHRICRATRLSEPITVPLKRDPGRLDHITIRLLFKAHRAALEPPFVRSFHVATHSHGNGGGLLRAHERVGMQVEKQGQRSRMVLLHIDNLQVLPQSMEQYTNESATSFPGFPC